MEAAKEALMNAETAFANRQYGEALDWYHRALEYAPDDVYILSRTGAICVPLGRFEEALAHFKRAKELDPENGDNAFNYANACFFNKDNVGAFEGYVEAVKLGCSDDVTPKLYYQMALLCSMRQDYASALVYFSKCEESDRSGAVSLNPDLISEKIKLYMISQDYANAEKYAAQYVAIQPSAFKPYMVYYSILMAAKHFDEAERVLNDARKYSVSSDDDRFTLTLQFAALYMAMGTEKTETGKKACEKAIQLLTEEYEKGIWKAAKAAQLLMTLAEAYLKIEDFDQAIHCLRIVLAGSDTLRQTAKGKEAVETLGNQELSLEALEEMIYADMEVAREKIDTAEINIDYLETDIDEEGHIYHIYDSAAIDAMIPAEPKEDRSEQSRPHPLAGYAPTLEEQEKVYFSLLSAYMGKESFEEAEKYALILKHSDQKYYSYFGLYASALLARKIHGSCAETRRKYDEALAFFRSRTFSDPGDSLAAIFRARLYTEDQNIHKAKEIAMLLSDEDRAAVLQYIETCKA